MLFTRRVTRQATAVSSLICRSCNLIRVSRLELHNHVKHNSVVESIGLLTDALGSQNVSTHQISSFSTMTGTFLSQTRDVTKLSIELERAVQDGRFSDAWMLYEQHIHLGVFPENYILRMLITSSAESCDAQWLEKAYGLVEEAFDEGNETLFDTETLIYLSFSLAKCGKAVPASTILRKLIELENFPPVAAWSAILAHMAQTAPGACLAAELILEISYLFQDGKVDPRKKSNAPLIAMKPTTITFNTALVGCLLFGTTRKAELLLEMMPRVGVKANIDLLVIMAHIYERNGRRNELLKLQRHIEEVHNLSGIKFHQFYYCLVSCHLKFGDVDSASSILLEMLRKEREAKKSLATSSHVPNAARNFNDLSSRQFSELTTSLGETNSSLLNNRFVRNTIISYKEFSEDSTFSKFEAEAKRTLDTLTAKLHREVELIAGERDNCQSTEEIFVKLVKCFLDAGKISCLAQFLIKAEKEEPQIFNDNSLLVHVINSCISLGWLDEAHDLLDEVRLAKVRTGSSVYASLLKAYCKADRAADVTSLLRDARKAGIQLDSSCYEVMMQSQIIQTDLPRTGLREFETLKGSAENGEAGFLGKLLDEIKEGKRDDYAVHDWNNVIHFFCKKGLMQDAEKALLKMRSLGHTPNGQTFHSMVTGYAAVGGKYSQVTDLWGQMKSISYATSMKLDCELLDSVLYTFVRGGFFSRANEVIELMENEKMFIDKYKYRTLFLKYHRKTCKGKTPKSHGEGQMRKREAALDFKNWIGLY